MSMILILVFGVEARSVTPAVGRPPTQKKASIFLSLSALTLSATVPRSESRSDQQRFSFEQRSREHC
jgi:hypothetical protein